MEHNPIIAIWFSKLVEMAASLFGYHSTGKMLVPTHLSMAFISVLIIVILFKLVVKNLQLFPNKMQVFLEELYKFFRGLVDDLIGHEGRKFIPIITTLGLFIAVSNLLGFLPEMAAPTSNLNVTASCALFIFIYYHIQGVKRHGFFGYLKTFAGPVWWLSPLFFPIEIISHLSRPLSLAMRLFGNIYGEDLVIIIIASIVPFVAPLPIMALATFTAFLQSFIFVMLSLIYLSGAVSDEH